MQKQAEEEAKKQSLEANADAASGVHSTSDVSPASPCEHVDSVFPEVPATFPTSSSISQFNNANPSQPFSTPDFPKSTATNTRNGVTSNGVASGPGMPAPRHAPVVTISETPPQTLSPKKTPVKRPTTANGQFLRTSVKHLDTGGISDDSGRSDVEAGVVLEEEVLEVTEIEGSTENLRTEKMPVSMIY